MTEPLTESETDALSELFNVGLHRAAASLSDVTGQRIIVDMPKLVELLKGVGAANDPGFQRALPYLAPFGQLAAGSASVEDDYQIADAVLTFGQ